MGVVVIQKSSARRGVTLPDLSVPLVHRWRSDRNVIVTGQGVSSWIDTEAALDLVQATDSQRPLFVSDAFGAEAGLSFDGVDDVMGVTSLGAITQPFSIVFIFGDWAALSNNAHLFRSDSPDVQVNADGTNNVRMRSSTNVDLGHDLPLAGTRDLISVFDGAASEQYVDALIGTTRNPGTADLAAATWTIGATNVSGAFPCDITIAEILIYNGALTQADANLLNGYRITRYGS